MLNDILFANMLFTCFLLYTLFLLTSLIIKVLHGYYRKWKKQF